MLKLPWFNNATKVLLIRIIYNFIPFSILKVYEVTKKLIDKALNKYLLVDRIIVPNMF